MILLAEILIFLNSAMKEHIQIAPLLQVEVNISNQIFWIVRSSWTQSTKLNYFWVLLNLNWRTREVVNNVVLEVKLRRYSFNLIPYKRFSLPWSGYESRLLPENHSRQFFFFEFVEQISNRKKIKLKMLTSYLC